MNRPRCEDRGDEHRWLFSYSRALQHGLVSRDGPNKRFCQNCGQTEVLGWHDPQQLYNHNENERATPPADICVHVRVSVDEQSVDEAIKHIDWLKSAVDSYR